jgi:hypothetical protein
MMEVKRTPGRFKNKFTAAEDYLLLEVVDKFGCRDWAEVASHIEGRNARQCRERWNNYVNPSIAKVPWTSTEEALLEQKFREYGTKWQTIASFFPSRSKNHIKNHWLTKQRRLKKKTERACSVSEQRAIPDSRNQVRPIIQADECALIESIIAGATKDESAWFNVPCEYF